MSQHTPGPCGCRTDDGLVLEYPYILYCPLHAKAGEMRNMLDSMATFFMNGCQCRLSSGFTCIVHRARALLAELEGRDACETL